MTNASAGQGQSERPKYHYFVDTRKYETEKSSITGAEIKAAIQTFDPSYQLFLEEPGDAPDRPVTDTETITLDPARHGVRRFYTVPPATFGCR